MRTLIAIIAALSTMASTAWADERVPVAKIAMRGASAFKLVAYMGCGLPEVIEAQPNANGGLLITGGDSVRFCYWGAAGHVFIVTEGGGKYVLAAEEFTPVF